MYSADRQSQGSADIRFIRSDDGGRTWSQPVTVVPAGQAASTGFGLVVDQRTGVLYLAFTQPGSCYSLATAKSADRGITWSAPVVVAACATSVSMAMPTDGTIAVRYNSRGVSSGYSVATSVGGGLSWSAPVQLAAVDQSLAPNGFLGDYIFELAGGGGVLGAAYANTLPGIRPSAAIYYADVTGTKVLLSATDPFAGCTINPLL